MFSTPLIQLKQVSKQYITRHRVVQAIHNISFIIHEGEFVSLVGPSGCGKSTILSLIAGLIHPSSGRIQIGKGSNVEERPQVGYMLQQDYLLKWRTVEKNLYLGLEIQKRDQMENREAALHLLEEIGLLDYKDAYPDQLSGGMRQRVAFVRTLAIQPEVLLLDEPFSALDYQTKIQLEELVKCTLKRHQKTGILVTHDIGEAIAMSDRIFLLSANPGTLIHELSIPPELREASPFAVRQFPIFQHYFEEIWKELRRYE
ncbi:ABC transporter ATP-binding protein [Rubeoparvulum massiliense]|uniref:ABC transporter ATP-binding protein n=1 Tax=Rubeoparvulum massiliense TaxID=1631346 RepID=UPI00069FF152|nr:ATP-binding cassette domain-containing protein [Rubeoparvulum massiliense]